MLHGLRKAAARRLAEAGCTEKEIAAITGHTTLKEVARYTRAADQKRLAAGALDKLTERKAGREFPTPQQVWENLAAISSVVRGALAPTDFTVDITHSEFPSTGLRVTSVLRLHKLATVEQSVVVRRMGRIGPLLQHEVDTRLRAVLGL